MPLDPDDPLAGLNDHLTALATQCTFNTTTGLMTVSIAAGETAVIARSSASGSILQNGQPCDNPATATTVKKIEVNGSSGAETLLLDFTNGLFAVGTSSVSSSGIVVDLKGGSDKLAIKGTSSADVFTFGADAILLNTDSNKDITYAGVEDFVLSLGDGNDLYSAAGNAASGAAFGNAIDVYGGAGDDVFNQGTVATPSETIYGGTGTDTVSYALRTAPIGVTIGSTADDGLTGENDDIQADIEVITGGTDADSLTAGTLSATLNGGAGDDTLIGGPANDTLNGGAGNDILQHGRQ